MKKKRVRMFSRVSLLSSLMVMTAAGDIGQFGTTPNLIGLGAIRGGGPPKDGIPALNHPTFIDHGEVTYLKPDDLVIGVEFNGEARAYPLRILIWHEAVNDTVGGVPVLVSYCPLCHSSLVFHRHVGGQVREFGISGLLYDSNVLLYDRQPNNLDSSLWSQAEMRAVTGPAAGERLELELLPAELTTYADWVNRRPATRVLSDETGHSRSYNGTAYAAYFDSDALMFGVNEKRQRPPRFKRKEPMVVVHVGERSRAYAFADILKVVGPESTMYDMLDGRRYALMPVGGGKSVRVEAIDGGEPLATSYLFWFSLSAAAPDTEVFDPKR
jgi:hypothetical protein